MPIVQPGAFELPIVNFKTQWFDEMEHRAGRRAGPGDVAGVHGDLRLDQHDIYHTQALPLSIDSLPAHYIVTQHRQNYNIKIAKWRKIFNLFSTEAQK